MEGLKAYVVPRLRLYGRRLLTRLGINFYQTDRWYRGNDDRRLLETQILPWYASRADIQKILFIGAQWYTCGYRQLFAERSWRVMELDPRTARRWGGFDAIAASCVDVAKFVPEESLDLILFTGVFGYGLNTRVEMQAALAGFYNCLRPGGELLFGYDDVPWHAPFDPSTLEELQNFEAVICPLFQSDSIVSRDSWRKTYLFLRRPI